MQAKSQKSHLLWQDVFYFSGTKMNIYQDPLYLLLSHILKEVIELLVGPESL